MEKQLKFYQTVPGVALATLLVLSIPLIAMQFTNEVNWSLADFILMGALLFSAGASYILITRYANNFVYRLAMAAAIGSTLLMIWANLAVGLIGSGPHAGNLFYGGVVVLIVAGAILSNLKAKGMQYAMFTAAGSLVLLASIALLSKMQEYPGSSVQEIIGVNAFFATLYLLTGLLFRNVMLNDSEKKAAD